MDEAYCISHWYTFHFYLECDLIWFSRKLLLHAVRSFIAYIIDRKKKSDAYRSYYMYRGTFKTRDAVALRQWFFKLSEMRSLLSDDIPFVPGCDSSGNKKSKGHNCIYLFFDWESLLKCLKAQQGQSQY